MATAGVIIASVVVVVGAIAVEADTAVVDADTAVVHVDIAVADVDTAVAAPMPWRRAVAAVLVAAAVADPMLRRRVVAAVLAVAAVVALTVVEAVIVAVADPMAAVNTVRGLLHLQAIEHACTYEEGPGACRVLPQYCHWITATFSERPLARCPAYAFQRLMSPTFVSFSVTSTGPSF
jgi:hypothetical protein